MKAVLNKVYQKLYRHFGPQHWWPGDTPFEIIVGAILTQNTNWGNVEKALAKLKEAHCLTPKKLHELSHSRLAALVKPAGYFNIKAKRLKNFLSFLFKNYNGNLKEMGRQPLSQLRKELLHVNGIGPETADSILLYAFNKPIFVVDAYTKRFLYRHRLVEADATYHEIQEIFETHLSKSRKLFNEYHALIVMLGKHDCKPHPKCEDCPLNTTCYSLNKRCPKCYRYQPKGRCQICR